MQMYGNVEGFALDGACIEVGNRMIPTVSVLVNFRCYFQHSIQPSTPLKINMEHNHGGLEDHFPL